MVIRPECSDDVGAIYAVHASAFPTEEEAKLVDRLRAANHLSVSFVAEHDGQVVGHIAFSPVLLKNTPGGLGLAPMGVMLEYQRRGIGDSLVRKGLEAAVKVGAEFVVVLGHPTYYP